jgi:Nodulation protein Z (NodZ)
MTRPTIVDLQEIEDQAPKFGFSRTRKARFASGRVGLKESGLSYLRLAPNFALPSATATKSMRRSTCSRTALRRVWVTEASTAAVTGGRGWVLVKGCGGFGNRILSVLTGLLYARRAGRRLVVDWRDMTYSNDRTNVFHEFFECSACGVVDELPTTASVRPGIWVGHLEEPIEELRRQHMAVPSQDFIRSASVALTKVDHDETVLVVSTFSAKVAMMRSPLAAVVEELRPSRSTDAVLSRLLATDLRLHPHIRERVDAVVGKQLAPEAVGVHVRYTDRKIRLRAILGKVDALLEREPRLQVFLATDSIHVRELFERRYRNLLTMPHGYDEAGKHWHPESPDRRLDGVEALVDLYLLAECDRLVIDTSSSFSYLAKLLSKASRPRVDDVNPFSPRFRELVKRLMPAPIRWGV